MFLSVGWIDMHGTGLFIDPDHELDAADAGDEGERDGVDRELVHAPSFANRLFRWRYADGVRRRTGPRRTG